jgi:hypothetical protein
MRRRDVVLSDGFMVVRRGGSPPMHKPICDELKPVLEKWLQVVDFTEWLFPADNRLDHWNPQVASKALKTACIAAGVAPFSFARLLRCFSERGGRLPPRVNQETPRTGRPAPLALGAPGEPVFIHGINQGVLLSGRHDVLRALFNAGRDGLSANELVDAVGKGGATKMARALREQSDEFRSLIQVPTRKGYPGSKEVYRLTLWD